MAKLLGPPLCSPPLSSSSSSPSLSSSSPVSVDALAMASSPPPSKQASRLLFRLRNCPPSSLKSTLRRSQHFPKATILATLRQLLLLQDWQLALPIYLSISGEPWYRWNANLHAHFVALLTKFDQQHHADSLMVDIAKTLDSKQLINLNCALIEHYSRYGLNEEMLASFQCMQALPGPRATFLAFSSLLRAYASMELPKKAEETLRHMQRRGFKPSPEDFRAVVFSYGRCCLFEEMELIACEMEMSELLFDGVVFNMIITTYATAQKHDKIKDWLEKMPELDIRPSVRSLNALSKACTVLNAVSAGSSCSAAVRLDGILEKLEAHGATHGELQTVRYLLKLAVLEEAVVWDPYWKLDLHGTETGSAYVMLFCWLKEVLGRLKVLKNFSSDIIIVTGWGKHSDVRGSSSVRSMVRGLLESTKSPFMIDSKNKGRLLARPHAMVIWLSQLSQ